MTKLSEGPALAVWLVAGTLIFAAAPSTRARQEQSQLGDEFEQVLTNARRLAIREQYEEAVKEFKKAARLRNDQCAECYRLLGQVYFQMRKYKDAASSYRQAITLKPENEAEINNLLGVALYIQEDKKLLEEAASAFRRAIELSNGRLVRAHYNLGYTLIKQGKEEEGVAALKAYLAADPSTNNANEVRAIIANPRLARERFASGFKVASTTGEELSLDRLKGKIVLLDFWATWCGPCRVEMPEVKSIWKRYGGDQFVIIGVSLDGDRAAFEAYLRKEGITWPQYYDGLRWGNKIARLYNVRAIPHTVLIDQDGIVRAVALRGDGLSSKIGELVTKLRKQSGEKSN